MTSPTQPSGQPPRPPAPQRRTANLAGKSAAPPRGHTSPGSLKTLDENASEEGANRRSTATSSTATASRSASTGGSMKTKELGHRRLRYRFMLVMAGVTVVVMALLGTAVSLRANTFLFSQKQHDGIELSKVAAFIVNAAGDRLDHLGKKAEGGAIAQEDINRVVEDMQTHLRRAATWDNRKLSDILSISVSIPVQKYPFGRLQGIWYGEKEIADANVIRHFDRVFVPKTGDSFALASESVAVSELVVNKQDQGQVPIYRFKVPLDARFFGKSSLGENDSHAWNNTPHLRLDVEITSINRALNNLTTAIIIIVVIATFLVVGVADWLARRVTRPLERLVVDMQIVAKGNLKHVTKPTSDDEIGVLALEFNRMTTQLNEAQGALVEQEKAEYELSIAREVQKQMLPLDSTTTPFPDGGTFYAFSRVPGWAVGAYYKGAKAVSGDYFDVFDLGNGLWGMCVADVSGKGIPGSMVMAVTRTIVRLVASKHLTRAHETLKETNRLIAKQIKRGMFVTCYYAVLDERSGQLTYASAGHNPMVLYRAASKSYELASGKGIALGFNEGPIFDRTIEVNTTQLASGDGLVLYTDGFPEAMNDKSQEFGDERFYEAVVRHAQLENQLAIMNVVGEIAKHRGAAEQSDDLTILMATRA